jgi:hypothetical protein
MVEEIQNPVHTLKSRAVYVRRASDPDGILLVAFKRADEEVRITRTGVGSGDIVTRGEVLFVGAPIPRKVLVDQDRDMAVLYGAGGEIQRETLVFSLSLDYRGTQGAPQGLSDQTQAIADQIVTSFTLRDD